MESNAEKSSALAEGLRQLATFIENHPELYGDLSGVAASRLCYILGSPSTREQMLTIARAALAAGATASERVNDSKWGYLDLAFGPVKVQVYTDRSWLGAQPAPPVDPPGYVPLLDSIEPVWCVEPVGHDGPHRSAHAGIWPEDGETDA